ncbi:bisanhydrobacterioruberin hydratase CruF [Salisaeta longa]|uniref:bisanhydrobacterioruberin hydratase CruF n=1 Tax=Salisaeta longa TaxID=503170 RepID=UPI0003B2FA6A|nr:bisanhydrobacterioruberin hydratase CruF [Salisaeta longa]
MPHRKIRFIDLPDTIEQVLTFVFWLFVGSIAFSVMGLLLLRLFPSVMQFFGPMYTKLVKSPTWTYMTLLAVMPLLMYGASLGWKRMTFIAAWGCIIGGASELIGTTGVFTPGGFVFPFGAYEYTHWLGAKIAGHVPYFIPPSWFAMSIVSLDLARRVADTRWAAVAWGTLFMVLWDVSLDPAMSRAFPFWTYGVDGFYYGMPLSNWFGWAGVTFVILVGYEYLGGGLDKLSRWAPAVYALNCLFPLAICLLQGLYVAALVGAAATALPFVIIWKVRGTPTLSMTPAQA